MWSTSKSPAGVRRVTWILTRGYRKHTIRSLDPERLQTSDFMDVSNVMQSSITAKLRDGRQIRGKVEYNIYRRLPFPFKTQGFLYCHHDPRLPPTTDEVRFRVMETSDPTDFQNGTDLMRADGVLPWSIPVLQLRPLHAPLTELIIQDGVIQPAILKSSKLTGLTFLEQPFVVTLEKQQQLRLCDSQLRAKWSTMRILLPKPGKYRESEFKGKLLVRFEQASVTEHVNDTTIVMRVLQILEPIQPLVEDAPMFQPTPKAGTVLESMQAGQIRRMEFNNPFLRLLPSITATPPPPSSHLEPTTDEKASTLVTALPRTVSTLDPRRLQPSDFMILSDLHGALLWKGSLRYKTGDFTFPSDTQGFLYMHLKPHLPLLTGQIRFRITPSNDPMQFEKGTDLVGPHGEPWNINALQIAYSSAYALLKEQLYHDGYAQFVQALLRLPRVIDQLPRRRMMYYLEQPLIMDMSCYDLNLTFISADQIRPRRLQNPLVDRATSCRPYAGRLVLRFERSTLLEHAKGNFAVLRVLKILDPIKSIHPDYNKLIKGLPIPRVGALLLRSDDRPCSFNLDSERGVGALKYLPSIPNDEPDLASFQ